MRFKNLALRCLPAICALALALALFTGCGATAQSVEKEAMYAPAATAPQLAQADFGGGTYGEAVMAGENGAPMTAAGNADGNVALPQDERKVIMTAFLDMETLDFDATCAALEKAVNEAGGYTPTRNLSTNYGYHGERMAYYVAKIPVEQYNPFITQASALATLRSRNESSEDVTSQYMDLQARLDSLTAQRTRLRELMGQTGTLEELLQVERQLSEVQYEIDNYASHMKTLTTLITYSTVNISLYEVKEITQPEDDSYLTRIATAFRSGWRAAGRFFREFSIALAGGLPFLLFLAAVAIVTVQLVKRARKKQRTRLAAPGQPIPPPVMAPPPAQTPPPVQTPPPAAAPEREETP